MKAQVKRNAAGYYDLWVAGRIMVNDESFGVCDSIADALNKPRNGEYSESSEVADSIAQEMAVSGLY